MLHVLLIAVQALVDVAVEAVKTAFFLAFVVAIFALSTLVTLLIVLDQLIW